jgi:hypothetical protein
MISHQMMGTNIPFDGNVKMLPAEVVDSNPIDAVPT